MSIYKLTVEYRSDFLRRNSCENFPQGLTVHRDYIAAALIAV